MKEVFEEIISAFQSLWSVKYHGETTIEISTPIATTTDMFVSVFVTRRGSEFVVTDGAWLYEEVYNDVIHTDTKHEKILQYYKEKFDILETQSGNRTYYYKKVEALNLLPNLVFDIANFIGAIASTNDIAFSADKAIFGFKRKATEFLKKEVARNAEDFEFDKPLPNQKNGVRFSAVQRRGNVVSVVNFVSGSTSTNFVNSLCRSKANIEIAREQRDADFSIGLCAILYDDNILNHFSSGMAQEYLDHLRRKEDEGYSVFPWVQRNSLQRLLA